MNQRFEKISPGRIYDTKTEKEYTCIIDSELLRIINSLCDENEKLVKTNIHLCEAIQEDMRCKEWVIRKYWR